jgi:hypothetical protein
MTITITKSMTITITIIQFTSVFTIGATVTTL